MTAGVTKCRARMAFVEFHWQSPVRMTELVLALEARPHSEALALKEHSSGNVSHTLAPAGKFWEKSGGEPWHSFPSAGRFLYCQPLPSTSAAGLGVQGSVCPGMKKRPKITQGLLQPGRGSSNADRVVKQPWNGRLRE